MVEGVKPVGDIIGDGAHMVVEGAETILGYLALVKGDSLDFVLPSTDGAIDGEILGGEVVVEEIPMVFGCFDIEFQFLCVLVHINLGLDLDGDAEGLVVDTHKACLTFAEESEGGVVLPAEVVEEHGGAHGVGYSFEFAVGQRNVEIVSS